MARAVVVPADRAGVAGHIPRSIGHNVCCAMDVRGEVGTRASEDTRVVVYTLGA